MAAWKQILFAIAILMAAAVAGYMFVPGSAATLARLGIGSVENPATATGSIGGQEEQGARAVSVVTAPVSTATINDRLSAIGTGRARATVSVTPYGSGRLTELLVQSGARVETGQVIARLDSATEEIAVDRARAARDDAVARVERIRQLRTSTAAR
jgi:multidrug efflux pump subunit AcrA (membrane-fusion protein)